MLTAIRTHPLRTAFVAGVAAVLCAVALWPSSGQAAGRTQTLRFFEKSVSVTLTQADGTVIKRPPFPEAKPGDVLDANGLEYAGNHRRHAAHASGSSHVRCTFTAAGTEPTCQAHVAFGGSMLVFDGNPGTLVNGTGRYQGATGRVLTNREVEGGSDVVARITLR
jgi:hypothetical protein